MDILFLKQLVLILTILGSLDSLLNAQSIESTVLMKTSQQKIKLPKPREKGKLTVEEALLNRRSVREYSSAPLTISDVAQLLWAAQGITRADGYRTAPSAGALYPLEVYIVAGRVDDLASGVYRYDPRAHELLQVATGDKRTDLSNAALQQECIRGAPGSVVLCAVYERTTGKYGERGKKYVHMEAGHAAQNIYLQATALNLGTVVIGAFYDDRVKKVMQMPADEVPLYIMPVGRM